MNKDIQNRIKIVKGINKNDIEIAALIYYEAFRKKILSGDMTEMQALELLKRSINTENCFAVYYDDALVAFSGFYKEKKAFMKIKLIDCADILGLFEGFFYFIFSAMLNRPPAKKELQMDGIAVRSDFRGNGFGSMLLKKLIEYGKYLNFNKIKLDVIDGNDGAHRLYLKTGFKDIKRHRLGILGVLYGIKGFTHMHYTL